MRKLFVMLAAIAVLSLSMVGCSKSDPAADTNAPPMPMSGSGMQGSPPPPAAADDM